MGETKKQWRSIAVWPKDVVIVSSNNNTTIDEHYTYEQAKGVCTLLNIEGFGGERKIFPINTFVEKLRI